MTTSKKVLWICWITFIGLIVLKCKGFDVTDAIVIVGGALASVVTGFYMWKSKCENKEKIAYGAVEKFADKYGIENIVSLISEILKE